MSRPLKLFLLFSFSLLGLGGLLVTAWALSQETYTIYEDGRMIQVQGEYETVAEVLAAAAITTHPEDIIQPDLNSPVNQNTPIQVQHARAVTVRSESGTRTYFTHQTSLISFLNENGLVIQRTDQVYADGLILAFNQIAETPLPDVLEIGNFLTVTIHEGAEQRTVRTAVQTVGAAIQEAGITLFAADGVEPPLGSWLAPDLHIYIQRSQPYTILVDGRTVQTRSHSRNVTDVLTEAGVGLIGYDFTRPGPETLLQPNQTIEVVRVTEDFRLVDVPIPYETLWQATDQVEIDNRALLQAGTPGIQRQRVRVRYENGVEVSQRVDGEWTALEPVNEIIGYGTKIVIRVLDTPDGAVEYWRVVRMRVTSYTAASSGKEPDDPAYGITASGLPAGTGIVAVDRAVIPFRTYVYVPGYGTGYAGDTGGGVRGRWIDLGYHEEEYVGWSGYVDVYYLTPVPPADRINYLIPTTLP